MDARQLSHFLAVVEHQGISKAARALRVSQPSLSQSIKQLERELRVELLVRTSRGARPTTAGRSLLEPARQVLRDLRVAQESVDEVVGLRGGTLDIVAVPAMALHPLAHMVGAYRRQFPHVTVRVVDPEDVAEAAAMVRRGDCEIGLVEDIGADEVLRRYALESQDAVLVLPPGSPVGTGVASWEDLAAYEFITSPPGKSASRNMLEHIFATTGAELRISVESDHRTAIADFVMAGAGAALLRRPIAESMQRQGARLCELAPALTRQVNLIHRTDVLGPAARAFVAMATRRAPSRGTDPAEGTQP